MMLVEGDGGAACERRTNKVGFFFLSLKIAVKPKHLSVGGTSMQLEDSHTSCTGILHRNPASTVGFLRVSHEEQKQAEALAEYLCTALKKRL